MKIKIAGIVSESIVDGPGIRFTVFMQGCPHHCPGCHNPQTHDPASGEWMETEEIITQFAQNSFLKGITLSGGDPFCQPLAAAELARAAHQYGKDVITYTGYTFEQLLSGAVAHADALLEQTDILIDGRFEQEKKSLALRFRGSSNQRAIDCKESLKFSRAVEIEL